MSDSWNSGIAFASLSDIGMRRLNNQDSFTCVPAVSQERFLSHGHLFVVADGMGAHAAGELASEMATQKISMHYSHSMPEDYALSLRRAVEQANGAINDRGQSNPEFHNMGTTASSLVLTPAGAIVAHVGDSRVYRLRDGVLQQLTFDHSLVWELEASGQANNSAFGSSIPKNVITRSLGPHPEVDVDVEGPFRVKVGDQYMLCSDGLTGLVEDSEIGVLMDCLPEDHAVRVLVDLANLRGGPDNTTVLIVRVNEMSAPSGPTSKVRMGDNRGSGISPFMVAATIICMIGAAVLALLQSWGPMIVAITLGLISATASLVMLSKSRRSRPHLSNSKGGHGPYRECNAKPTIELYDRLGHTIEELKEAASNSNWLMNWTEVKRYQDQGSEAIKSHDLKKAIAFQAEAIMETMNQLREQQNRAANETAIDR